MAEHKFYGQVSNTDVKGSWKWRGNFATGTRYAPGDVVRYQDATYLCRQTHTATSFVSASWELLAAPPSGVAGPAAEDRSAYQIMGVY